MAILASVLAVLVLGEGGGLWLLWSRWRSELARAAANDLVVTGLHTQLVTAYRDAEEARKALAARNQAEDASDKTRVATAPGLDDALSRINQLWPATTDLRSGLGPTVLHPTGPGVA